MEKSAGWISATAQLIFTFERPPTKKTSKIQRKVESVKCSISLLHSECTRWSPRLNKSSNQLNSADAWRVCQNQKYTQEKQLFWPPLYTKKIRTSHSHRNLERYIPAGLTPPIHRKLMESLIFPTLSKLQSEHLNVSIYSNFGQYLNCRIFIFQDVDVSS